MKRIILFCICTLLITSVFAQFSKVNWESYAKKLPNGKYELHMVAKIPAGYHLYSQSTGDGPVATNFTFNKNALISLEGKVKEKGKMIVVDDEVWKNKQKYYAGTVDFVQIVKPKAKVKTNVSGNVGYMICDDKKCLPPTTYAFNVALN